ncbi:MAG TPA: cache domain-containing protein [Smithella sp.]|nr:cache domain-containing protein [Smithella sp.]MDM7988333.1 cache domain-containing protein [Smithella sp.]HNY51037.1 cache domain-containing protein [Smithella sp.]HOG91146.1 cache domain-containing protein [Smithella sp.]HOU51400.1 cache domain-containing protein [Smithella sp.]
MIRLIRSNRMNAFPTLLILLSLLISGCENRYENLDISVYQYRDTKDLVKFVYDASRMIKKDGLKSVEFLKNDRQIHYSPDRYLYIYYMNGVNIYHAGMPHLEGKNLWELKDKNGKKPIQMVIAAIKDQNNPHAWVHYSWWEPGKFYPVPKSSCHFKVTTPEGQEIFVGGGLNYPHEEKEFIRILVDNAAQLIRAKGHDALAEIADPASSYNFRDVKVFAFTPEGKLLISPVMNDSIADFKLMDCVDEMGHKPFAKALNGLKNKDSVWEVFLAKNRYQRTLIKKSLYLRKTYMAGQEIFVGAITDLPQPPG